MRRRAASEHSGRDAEGDAPIFGPLSAFMCDVVVQVGIDLVDSTFGDRWGKVPRVAQHSVPPARPGARVSHGLRGDAWGSDGVVAANPGCPSSERP
jgi:hypothetical protein